MARAPRLSKAKGMWLGGACPLGYDPPADREVRALVVNEAEAETVRMIFRRYLELGSVHLLTRDLQVQGVVSKQRTFRDGRRAGGVPINRGALFYLLKNRTYLGQIVHKDVTHPGLHTAIVSRDLFDRVQEKLVEQTPKRRARAVGVAAMPLKGIIFDADGAAMSPTTARGKHPTNIYRYYVSTTLQTGRGKASPDKLQRVPVDRIHRLIVGLLTKLLPQTPDGDRLWSDLLPALERVEVTATAVRLDVRRAVVAPRERGPEQARDLVSARLGGADEVWTCPDRPDLLRIVVATRMRLRGGRSWVQLESGAPGGRQVDRILVRGLRDAHRMLRELGADPEQPAKALVVARAPEQSLERMRANIALLAPRIQAAILEGRLPPGLTLERLADADMPLAWTDQVDRLQQRG